MEVIQCKFVNYSLKFCRDLQIDLQECNKDEYDFLHPNQSCFQNPHSSLLLTIGGQDSENKIGMTSNYLEHAQQV